jgi:hypothetical protein
VPEAIHKARRKAKQAGLAGRTQFQIGGCHPARGVASAPLRFRPGHGLLSRAYPRWATPLR